MGILYDSGLILALLDAIYWSKSLERLEIQLHPPPMGNTQLVLSFVEDLMYAVDDHPSLKELRLYGPKNVPESMSLNASEKWDLAKLALDMLANTPVLEFMNFDESLFDFCNGEEDWKHEVLSILEFNYVRKRLWSIRTSSCDGILAAALGRKYKNPSARFQLLSQNIHRLVSNQTSRSDRTKKT